MRRVQGLAPEIEFIEQGFLSTLCSTINGVAQQGVTERLHMHPHLMGASRLQAAFDQRCINRACRPG